MLRNREVSPRDKIFIKEYLASKIILRSMVKAGFSEIYARKRGWSYIRRPSIQRELKGWNEQMKQDIKATREWVQNNLVNIVENSEKDADKIKALSEINKMEGYHAPAKQEVSFNGKLDPDDPEVKRIIEIEKELLEKNKKDY